MPTPAAVQPVPVPAELLLLRVTDVTEEAEGVRSYRLAAPDGADLPAWQPGAHVDVQLPGDLIRQYSLCSDPADRGSWRIAVLREPDSRGGSSFLHEGVRPGDPLSVTPPRNNFPLEPADRYLFLAGGIGITPLLPMIAAADRAGTPWKLAYGGRHRAGMAFLGELDRYGARVSVLPQDEAGLLPLPDLLAGDPGVVYCCGPEPLLAAVEDRCAGRPPGTVRMERFRPRPDAGSGPATSFEVVLGRGGRVVPVAAGQSILSALAAAGQILPSSCQEGTCASCETRVLDGEIDHRDSVLSEAERAAGDTMMICVSRARRGRLVLDL